MQNIRLSTRFLGVGCIDWNAHERPNFHRPLPINRFEPSVEAHTVTGSDSFVEAIQDTLHTPPHERLRHLDHARQDLPRNHPARDEIEARLDQARATHKANREEEFRVQLHLAYDAAIFAPDQNNEHRAQLRGEIAFELEQETPDFAFIRENRGLLESLEDTGGEP